VCGHIFSHPRGVPLLAREEPMITALLADVGIGNGCGQAVLLPQEQRFARCAASRHTQHLSPPENLAAHQIPRALDNANNRNDNRFRRAIAAGLW
jgi:hypothetical protein